jgi:hypothetical protein
MDQTWIKGREGSEEKNGHKKRHASGATITLKAGMNRGHCVHGL